MLSIRGGHFLGGCRSFPGDQRDTGRHRVWTRTGQTGPQWPRTMMAILAVGARRCSTTSPRSIASAAGSGATRPESACRINGANPRSSTTSIPPRRFSQARLARGETNLWLTRSTPRRSTRRACTRPRRPGRRQRGQGRSRSGGTGPPGSRRECTSGLASGAASASRGRSPASVPGPATFARLCATNPDVHGLRLSLTSVTPNIAMNRPGDLPPRLKPCARKACAPRVRRGRRRAPGRQRSARLRRSTGSAGGMPFGQDPPSDFTFMSYPE
jgi:hypothetical protein